MSAYYNEIDPYAAQWLRNLISAGHIAPGDVDERSIEDVCPADLIGYAQCHFFAGIGGWSLALRSAGWSDDSPAWTGSCPCQPFSTAGQGDGFNDPRHLWPSWNWLIKELRPGTIFGEQVSSRGGLAWLDVVSADLESQGYAIGAADLCAAGVGAPHIRQRLYWVANSDSQRQQSQYALLQSGRPISSGFKVARGSKGPTFWDSSERKTGADGKTRLLEPSIPCLADGVPKNLANRISGTGNAIVPQLGSAFVRAFMECAP